MRPAQEPLAAGLSDGARRLVRVAVAALARREYSCLEIERRLLQRLHPGESAGDVQAALARLQSKGLLSDERVAQAVARVRQARFGRLRIRQELERRGVNREAIASALPGPEQEAAAAWDLWRRKFGVPPANRHERVRQGRFLAARGFNSALIARILGRGAAGEYPSQDT